jgi:hypothetical protein
MTFPTVSGSNLLRRKLNLPQDFQGKLNLVFIAFQRWHQMEVDSWSALAEELEKQYKDLVYYELPTLQRNNFFIKRFSMKECEQGSPIPRPENARSRYTLTKHNSGTTWGCRMRSIFISW